MQTLDSGDNRAGGVIVYNHTCRPLALTWSMVRYLRSSRPAMNSSRISLYCSLMSSQKSALFL